jgi:hypothetical protein
MIMFVIPEELFSRKILQANVRTDEFQRFGRVVNKIV